MECEKDAKPARLESCLVVGLPMPCLLAIFFRITMHRLAQALVPLASNQHRLSLSSASIALPTKLSSSSSITLQASRVCIDSVGHEVGCPRRPHLMVDPLCVSSTSVGCSISRIVALSVQMLLFRLRFLLGKWIHTPWSVDPMVIDKRSCEVVAGMPSDVL